MVFRIALYAGFRKVDAMYKPSKLIDEGSRMNLNRETRAVCVFLAHTMTAGGFVDVLGSLTYKNKNRYM